MWYWSVSNTIKSHTGKSALWYTQVKHRKVLSKIKIWIISGYHIGHKVYHLVLCLQAWKFVKPALKMILKDVATIIFNTSILQWMQSLYPFSETNLKDFSRTQIDFFSRTQNLTLFIPTISNSILLRVYKHFLNSETAWVRQNSRTLQDL